MLKERGEKIATWRGALLRIDADLEPIYGRVLESLSSPDGCGPVIGEDLSNLRARIERAAQEGETGFLPDWVETAQEEAFFCVRDIAQRLSDAIDEAAAEGLSLRVRRLTELADELTRIDHELTRLFVAAEAARTKHLKLLTGITRLNRQCSEPEF
ncbi:hypothetical protein [Rhodosalinus sediminis]|uniref:hypothetical protein n=1 Tax=Rhodosalinus sediminis TaxID=1940533 RepID=UPI002357ECB5|nr:hypothetical protein [Rhodosalinus sediminis]